MGAMAAIFEFFNSISFQIVWASTRQSLSLGFSAKATLQPVWSASELLLFHTPKTGFLVSRPILCIEMNSGWRHLCNLEIQDCLNCSSLISKMATVATILKVFLKISSQNICQMYPKRSGTHLDYMETRNT